MTVTGPGMPLICVPTTCGSGSEVTGASVLTDNSTQKKASISSDYMMPLAALIDPQLHVSLPADVTAATGMDTLTHAIEAFVSKNSNPFSDAMAAMSISLVGAYLRRAFDDPNDITARSNMAAASTLGAIAFMNGGLGAVHGISQAMGGVAHVTHGIGNAVMTLILSSVEQLASFAAKNLLQKSPMVSPFLPTARSESKSRCDGIVTIRPPAKSSASLTIS